ncbi:hypothetical protein BST81_03165 [Leptolyngbya sp. 'hensonii']|uniref:tetratricopeptide repeat protein n=1 Tax=Leptolyngbya sp. 'hensonii' TaxID=1922337 RepID=UPI00094FC375|nr:tetratricopeptide repeat protein [Leptolyngbya sp. 'hensonii']OLP19905.1 hypothetical protein BST81_03165 [Leptolyngbya sp. 'hensonii']
MTIALDREACLQQLTPDDLKGIILHQGTGRLFWKDDATGGDLAQRSLTRREKNLLELALDFLQTPTYAEDRSWLNQLEGYWDAITYLGQAGLWRQVYQDVLLMKPEAVAPFTLHEQLHQLNNFGEQLQLYQTLLGQLGQDCAGLSFHGLGRAYYYQGQFQKARQCYEQLLQFSLHQQDGQMEIWALEGLVLVNLGEEQRTLAESYAQQLLERMRLFNHPHQLAQALALLGRCHNAQSKKRRGFQQALSSYQEALAILQQVADLHLEGDILAELIGIYAELRCIQEAKQYVDRFLMLDERLEDGYTRIQGYVFLGLFHTVQQDFQLAQEFLLTALKIARRLGLMAFEAFALHTMGANYARSHDFQSATHYFLQALSLIKRLKQLDSEVICRCNLSYCYSRAGQAKLAKVQALRAIIQAHRLDNPIITTFGLGVLGCAYWYERKYLQVISLLPRIFATLVQYAHWDNSRIAIETMVAITAEPIIRWFEEVRRCWGWKITQNP